MNYNTLNELLNAHPRVALGRAKDLTKNKFGRLQPICRVQHSTQIAYWACLCDCGLYTVVRGTHMAQGKIQSCGCYGKEQAKKAALEREYRPNHKDLTNQKFGYLTALKYIGNDISKHAVWQCKCDCGNIINVTATHLLTTHTTSCGCRKESKYEATIQKWLKEHGYNFDREVSIAELGRLRFDFKVYYNETYCYIEMQGRQHSMPIDYFGGQKEFERLVANDIKKKEYCHSNNVTLLEIQYYDDIERVLENFFS